MAVLELDTVKSWIKKTDTDRDDVLQALIDRAIESVQRELDWYFGDPRDTVEVLDGTGRTVLHIRQPPVDPDALVVSHRTGPTEDWTIIDDDDYEVDGRGLFHDTIWTRGRRNYRVEYSEGFVDPPGDITQFTLELVTAKWTRFDKAGLKSETLGRYSYTFADMMEQPTWLSVLQNWKRGRI